jgi:hypothetical protein
VTYTGHCLKYSIENLLSDQELQEISSLKMSADLLFFKKDNQSDKDGVPEGVLRMSFKIKDFFGSGDRPLLESDLALPILKQA